MNVIAYTDMPAKVDHLGAAGFVTGLASFIESCNTPMAISIRGAWGTGKTSLLEQIEDKIKSNDNDPEHTKYHVMWFNTWHFAQIGYEQNMTGALLASFIEELETLFPRSEEEEVVEKKKSFELKKGSIVPLITTTLRIGGIFNPLASVAAESFKDIAENLTAKKEEAPSAEPAEFISSITALLRAKDLIQQMINDAIPDDDQKLVILIDDLDRLSPRAAVNLLEGIKVFLDCKKCVFLLAIDDEVVYRGINEKYGLKDDDEEKGKMFFDKIIQIPFRVPIEQYEYLDYVKAFLDEDHDGKLDNDLAGDNHSLEEEAKKYVDIIDGFPQTEQDRKFENAHNPRSIKRAFNLQKLNVEIYKALNPDELHDLNAEKLRYLFAKHFIEIIDPELFQKLLVTSSDDYRGLCKNYPILTTITDLSPEEEEENADVMDAEKLRISNFLEMVRFNTSAITLPESVEKLRTLIETVYNTGKDVELVRVGGGIRINQKFEDDRAPEMILSAYPYGEYGLYLCVPHTDRTREFLLRGGIPRAQKKNDVFKDKVTYFRNENNYAINHSDLMTQDDQLKLAKFLVGTTE